MSPTSTQIRSLPVIPDPVIPDSGPVFDRWDLSTRVQGTRTQAAGTQAAGTQAADTQAAGTKAGEGDLLRLEPGRIIELEGSPGMGLTRLAYLLLAEPSRHSLVVVLDVRGWVSPLAAWEAGILRDRLVVVRCHEPRLWLKVAATLCEGVGAMVAEVPVGIRDADLHRLGALVRARQARIALRPVGGVLPSGVSHLRVMGVSNTWSGVERGHGRLSRRRLVFEASGKGMAGMTRRIEVEDSGADDVRVVSGLVARTAGHAV